MQTLSDSCGSVSDSRFLQCPHHLLRISKRRAILVEIGVRVHVHSRRKAARCISTIRPAHHSRGLTTRPANRPCYLQRSEPVSQVRRASLGDAVRRTLSKFLVSRSMTLLARTKDARPSTAAESERESLILT
jgi:hypothetical protein